MFPYVQSFNLHTMKIGVQGILYDDKSSFLKGPAKAPPLIRKALASDMINLFSETDLEITPNQYTDLGDFEIEDYLMIKEVTLQNLSRSSRLLTLGGDHSITYPVVAAYAERYGPVQILHIDAHGDLYDEFEGDKHSHACPFARIMENQLATRLVQVGIRAINPHQREQARKFGVEVHEMKTLDLRKLPKFDQPVYLSLDLDGIDPAFAPGVSHHEPGGLTSRQVISIIQQINTPILGADIVEYNPDRDIHDMTATLAAKLFKEIMAAMVANPLKA